MEVELRAKINNLEEIKKKLNNLGAVFISQKKLTDYYFGELSLYKKLGRSFWIRIRVKDDKKIELAYKGPSENDGIYEEYEQYVQDLETMLNILSRSGLENVITVSKKRSSFKLENINVELDEIEGKGTYIELEQLKDDTNRTELYELMVKLNVPKESIFEKGYITNFLREQKSPYSVWIVN